MYFLLFVSRPADCEIDVLHGSNRFFLAINVLNWCSLGRNSIEPTLNLVAAGLHFVGGALVRVLRIPSRCALSKRTSCYLGRSGRNPRRHPSALGWMRSCCRADSRFDDFIEAQKSPTRGDTRRACLIGGERTSGARHQVSECRPCECSHSRIRGSVQPADPLGCFCG